jgi:formylglycine-generating enzyme required for sulfatase activity
MKRKHVSSVILAAVLCISGNLLAACPSMDVTGDCKVNLADFAVFAEQWMTEGIPDPDGMMWVSINDPGIGGGRVGFNGEMSKYETTNAQYCQFLNAALASGDVTIDANDVIGANGTNTGQDFVGVLYYDGDGAGYTGSGATNGGAARIHYNGGVFSVDSGFENHPVTWVNWYGSTAFCNYYGYRLPTEWEWQAVADYTGYYTYGCGMSINSNIANYNGSYHPNGTTAVGAFGVYGYGMCDMAGNVFEWTSSNYYDYIDIRSIRGGSWNWGSIDCRVSGDGQFAHWTHYAVEAYYNIGFRACRGAAPVQAIVPNVIDMTQAQAEAAIVAAGLVVGTLTEEYSETVAAGNIISQYPYPGEEFQPGSTVNLVVSKGVFVIWVSINDPGVSGHEGFNGEMSKYEMTNAQYCEFLNAANAINWITVYNNVVYAAGDTSHSQPYFSTEAASSYSQITYSGGTFSVRSRDGYSMANHPVVMVSWYGATAFCNYYGYRLPTEWEWQAAADFDGSFTYGCGTTINFSKANYYYNNVFANPLGLTSYPYTSPVGYYPAYGYGMCDMAGNVCEWTSSCYYSDCSSGFRVVRGGSWNYDDNDCMVSHRFSFDPYFMYYIVGFRVCR